MAKLQIKKTLDKITTIRLTPTAQKQSQALARHFDENVSRIINRSIDLLHQKYFPTNDVNKKG